MRIALIVLVSIYLAWQIIHIIAYEIMVALGPRRPYAKMRWKMIKQLYPINPSKWSYTEDYDHEPRILRILFYKDIPIMLSPLNFILFRFAYKKYAKKNGAYLENHDSLKEILEDAQEDINKTREQADAQIKQAEIITREVEKNNDDVFSEE